MIVVEETKHLQLRNSSMQGEARISLKLGSISLSINQEHKTFLVDAPS
jgi:hypothetical protein